MSVSLLLKILALAFFILAALNAGVKFPAGNDWEWMIAGGLASVTLAGLIEPR
jgi:hypothetical protein